MSEIEIKVTPDVLEKKAQEVTTAINKMERCFDQVQNLVARTRYYWVGQAGEIHRELVTQKKEDMEQIIKRLKDHPDNLRKIAGTYRVTESEQTEQSMAMSSNLID